MDKRLMSHWNFPWSIVAVSAVCSVTLAAAVHAPPAHCATIAAQVRSPAGAGVVDAVVYAVSAAASALSKPGLKVPIEQIDREFVPYVSVVQAGTVVIFPNRDPILHHVYSFSRAKNFEIKLYSGTSPSEILFDQPGVVTLGCNIHDWMIAYVLVVETPYFATTDAQGNAQLLNVPAGKYDLKVWHPTQKGGGAAQGITVAHGGTAASGGGSMTASFVIDAAPRKVRYKPPLDKLRY
ncbi:MAG: methylamine utilization protein [Betaproteobacteria bacterium]